MIASLVSIFCMFKQISDNGEMDIMLFLSSTANTIYVNKPRLEVLESIWLTIVGTSGYLSILPF